MKKILIIPVFAILALILSFSINDAYAAGINKNSGGIENCIEIFNFGKVSNLV